ncbi:MAG: glycosyltransferase [Lachnospiraceae bacterium]|nr:glycosyltransferase [Lachnospiraceae bacterium]
MALISIIVPCYNAEDYVDRCMESIVHQTIGIENLEVILVNDASTDDTLNKLKTWEKQYPDQIMVVTYDNNLRQGGARNIGIQYANSDYIGFVDVDDWIELDMYEALYSPLRTDQYDVIRGKSIDERFPNELIIDNSERNDQKYEFENKGDFYSYDVDEMNAGNVGRWGGIWSGIYKKNVILDNQIFFPEHLAYEDNYWYSILKLYVRNMYVVDKIVYHYYINSQSTSHNKNSGKHFERLKIELLILEEYLNRGAMPYFHDKFEVDFIRRFYFNTIHIIFLRFDYIPNIFPYIQKVILNYFPNYKDNPYYDNFKFWEKDFLSLLEYDLETFTNEDWMKIKEAYLKGL